MKRCWMLLSLMMLLLCGHAAAELFTPVPAERIYLVDVPGLVADVVKTPGRVTVSVDVEKTDWKTVATYAYDAINPGINVFFGVEPPAGAVRSSYVYGSPGEDWAIDHIENGGIWNDTQPRTDITIADYEFSRGIVRPYDNMDEYGDYWIYVRWFDENDRILGTEKADIKIKHSTLQPFMTSISVPAASDFKAGVAMYGEPVPAISVISADRGTLSIEVQESGFCGYIYNGVRMPDGAVACESRWRWDSDFYPVDIENGYAILSDWFDGRRQEMSKENRVLQYRDADGKIIGVHNVCVQITPGSLKPWPCYVDKWHGYTENELDIWNPQPGVVDYTYDNDKSLITVRYVGGVPDSAEEKSYMQITFQPPENATFYKEIYGLQGNMMGNPSWFEEDIYDTLKWTDMEENFGSFTDRRRLFDSFTMEETNGSSVEVFLPYEAMPDENGGIFRMFFWYRSEADEEPFACTYYCYRIEPSFAKTIRQPAVHAEEEIQNLRYPVMLLDPHQTQNVFLVVEILPQKGENAIRYDLHVEDENGMPVPVPNNAWIYLPYPEGGGPDDNMQYLLQHFNANEQGIGYEKLTKETQGLRFKPKSLSPFLLSWTEAATEPEVKPEPSTEPEAQLPAVPKTGDSAHPMLWVMMMALAAVLLMVSLKKARGSYRS